MMRLKFRQAWPSHRGAPHAATPQAVVPTVSAPADAVLNAGFKSALSGFDGLVEEGRYYMLRATEQQQHAMVYNALAGLLTPAMPLVYKPFMSGVLGNRTFGPWCVQRDDSCHE
eukprot:1752944-Pleurochrysis_carterae.AAC.2